ncbi:hypothetical protein [Thalassospira alkalitolerans]|uniref:hypothetical protein n=1 Tax=Thalassospira alkalitolerans TaxID=1293890 RepID=UPI003AA8F249
MQQGRGSFVSGSWSREAKWQKKTPDAHCLTKKQSRNGRRYPVNPPLDSIYIFGISAGAAGDLARALAFYYTSCVPELRHGAENFQVPDFEPDFQW